MITQKIKGLLEGFLTGAAAATLLYTVLLNAGYIVSVEGVKIIADEKLKPLKDNVDTILVLSLEQRIRDLASEQCLASASLRIILQNEIDGLQKQHYDLTKTYYTISVKCV
jgi:hypothetical protein